MSISLPYIGDCLVLASDSGMMAKQPLDGGCLAQL